MAKDTTPVSAKPDTTTWATAGRNVRFQTLEGMLFIAVDISAPVIAAAPLSASGKSRSVGTTLGNVAIPGTVAKLGLNLYTPAT